MQLTAAQLVAGLPAVRSSPGSGRSASDVHSICSRKDGAQGTLFEANGLNLLDMEEGAHDGHLPSGHLGSVVGAAAAIAVLRQKGIAVGRDRNHEQYAGRCRVTTSCPTADLSATRAVTINAAAEDVWPWIAQLGQGQGRLLLLRLARKSRRAGPIFTTRIRWCGAGSTSRSATRFAWPRKCALIGRRVGAGTGRWCCAAASRSGSRRSAVRLHLVVRADIATRRSHPAHRAGALPVHR